MTIHLPELEITDGHMAANDSEKARELAWRICHIQMEAIVKRAKAGERISDVEKYAPVQGVLKSFQAIENERLPQADIDFLASLPQAKKIRKKHLDIFEKEAPDNLKQFIKSIL